MRFSDWFPLTHSTSMPGDSGLFQVKMSQGLLSYPKGKSAMFYYGYGVNLQAGVTKFIADVLPLLEHAPDELLIRHMPTADFEKKFRLYLEQFSRAFGSMPRGNVRHIEILRT
jgi:hypothetical protein